MFRLRRVFLFCPLVLLTLFFAACGWRNAHLTMNESEVRNAGMDWAFSNLVSYRKIYVPAAWKIHLPSAAHPYVSKIRFTKPPTSGFGGYVGDVGRVVVKSRFHATCCILYGDAQDPNIAIHTLTRSPLRFWDDKWYVAENIPTRPAF